MEDIKEKTADEMFEELDYKKQENETEIRYISGNTIMGDNFQFVIIFIKKLKVVGVKQLFNMQELQAINKKCKELGWI